MPSISLLAYRSLLIGSSLSTNISKLAKLRRNHGTGRGGKSFISRAVTVTVGLIGILIYGFLYWGGYLRGDDNPSHKTASDGNQTYSIPLNLENRNFIPVGDYQELIHHDYYSLDYNEKYEVPNWVAYQLTEESLKLKNVPRQKRFNPDPEVDGRSAKHSDYTHSGYTRGHMAPSADMAFSVEANKQCFLMSNMTPQLRNFNNGIWRELEENVRDWAYDNDEIYVVSGPIFEDSNPERIGKNKVAVPDAFFKVILDNEGSKKKGIAFIMPHEKSDLHLREYAVTIDEVESLTGLDLFADLLDDEYEETIESQMNVNQWQFNKKRFKQRVINWNRQK